MSKSTKESHVFKIKAKKLKSLLTFKVKEKIRALVKLVISQHFKKVPHEIPAREDKREKSMMGSEVGTGGRSPWENITVKSIPIRRQEEAVSNPCLRSTSLTTGC